MVLRPIVATKKDAPGFGIQMSENEFKQWLDTVGRNRGGRISRQELKDGLKALGMHFRWWKAWRALWHADLNSNGIIDGDLEIDELIRYANKRWGIITT